MCVRTVCSPSTHRLKCARTDVAVSVPAAAASVSVFTHGCRSSCPRTDAVSASRTCGQIEIRQGWD